MRCFVFFLLLFQLHGAGAWSIVCGAPENSLDRMAARELQFFLRAATGMEVALLDTAPAEETECFLVGSSAVRNAGSPVEETSLAPGEAVMHGDGKRVLLFGEGTHGTAYAVYTFLEQQLGIRWFSPYGKNHIPSCSPERLSLSGEQRLKPAFRYRDLLLTWQYRQPESGLFFFRNGINVSDGGLSSATYPELAGNSEELFMHVPQCHSLFYYLPPHPDSPDMGWQWRGKRSYFAEHPEYYSMDASGKRVDNMHLCFSNPALRHELTNRLLERIENMGGSGVFNISLRDLAGTICHCAACRALEQRYQTPGGPLFDYLIEAGNTVALRFPEAKLSTLAYRKDQTEIPPALPAGRLPDNLVIIFAPIDDNFAGDWKHPDNQGTYRNLRRWCEIADTVMVWYYPLPYQEDALPYAAFRRLQADLQHMRDAGVKGTYFEHDAPGVFEGMNFGDLYTYVQLRLFRNPDDNLEELIREFTDAYYGSAAPLFRDYLEELETLRETLGQRVDWSGGVYSYITIANLMRWQQLFDRMEELCQSEPEALFQLRCSRIPLDIALLGNRYQSFRKEYPDSPWTVEFLTARARKSLQDSIRFRYTDGRTPEEWLQKINLRERLARWTSTSLPEPLAEIEGDGIRIILPANADRVREWEVDAWPLPMTLFDQNAQRSLLYTQLSEPEMKPGQLYAYFLGETPLVSHFYLELPWNPYYFQFCSDAFNPAFPDRRYRVYVALRYQRPESPDKKVKITLEQILFIPCE